jgi:hypothetical protein
MILWFSLYKAYGWQNIWNAVTDLAMFTAVGQDTAVKNYYNVQIMVGILTLVYVGRILYVCLDT